MADAKLKRIAAHARDLSARFGSLPAEEFGPWMNELSGLLQLYFPEGKLDSDVYQRIAEPKNAGALMNYSKQLAAKSTRLTEADRGGER